VTGITMFDTAFNDQFPATLQAAAAYVDGGIGSQPNYAYIVSAFPKAHHLSIALSPAHDADCLDVESGAAAPADVANWLTRQRQRGIVRPCIYASVSVMRDSILPLGRALGLSVRLWTAHYGRGEHVCGPHSCGELPTDADGTQWNPNAMGRDLDQSLLAADFFGTPPAPSPVPAWQEAAMKALPLVSQGSTNTNAVRTVQGLLCARGHAVTVDGNFGPATLAALRALQKAHGLTADGIAGPASWPCLMGVQ